MQSLVMKGVGLVLAFAAFLIYIGNVGLDLKKTPKVVGRLDNPWVATHRTGRGGAIHIFTFNLDQTPQKLAVYRRSQDYADLHHALHPGDTVTVYFKPSPIANPNMDVYQIEKNGVILFNYQEYSHNYFTLSLLIGLLGVFILFMTWLFQLASKKQAIKKPGFH
jgi:hypothetical protein